MTARTLAPVVAGLLTAAGIGPAADPPKSGKYWVYVGTYTGGKAGSQGVYRSELDLATGKLAAPVLAAEMKDPTFLALAPSGMTLYAVGEVSNLGPTKKEGAVAAFAVDPATGALAKQNELTTGGAGPCHVAVSPDGRFLVTSNYGGGSCAFFTTKPDGSLDARTAFVQHAGTGATDRQKGPHAHCGRFDATGRLAFVADLGLDKLLLYRVSPTDGTVSPADPAAVKLPDGAGPRHVDFNAAGDTAYVCGELDSTVNVIKMDPANGKYEVVQTLSTLPEGKPVKGNSTAEVRVHPGGQYVYVSNRGHNSIAAFRVEPGTGKLAPIGHATEGIKVPRNFNIDPTGQWMLVASQDGDNVAVFRIDPETGLPKPTGETVAVGKPVCVKFLAKP